jgi:predicted nucleic acid-binding protein
VIKKTRIVSVKIYLDTCSLQRPLDSKTQIRIILESESILGVLTLCEAGRVELISSEVLVFEVERTPHVIRKGYALDVLSRARSFIVLSDQIENRARELTRLPLDALHLASAEEAQADYLCICDDKFLNRAKTIQGIKTRIVSPVELIEEIEKW